MGRERTSHSSQHKWETVKYHRYTDAGAQMQEAAERRYYGLAFVFTTTADVNNSGAVGASNCSETVRASVADFFFKVIKCNINSTLLLPDLPPPALH